MSQPTLRDKLAPEVLPTEWKMLAMHYRRAGLFIVGPGVSLLEVAAAVAGDEGQVVARWIEGGQLARPTEQDAKAWEAEEGCQFVSVIVQPFVLAQRLSDYATAQA